MNDNQVAEKDKTAAMISKEIAPGVQSMIDENRCTQSTSADASVRTDSMQLEKTQTYSKCTMNIVILGTVGSGKATLANKLANENIFVPQDVYREPKIREGKSTSGDYVFLLVDTSGAFCVEGHNDLLAYQSLQDHFKEHMHNGANLIIFTIRNGCSSPDEIKLLNYIIKERFGKDIDGHFALVITACEQIGLAKKSEFLKKMQETTADTKFIFDYAFKHKGVVLTAFPNLDEAENEDKVTLKEKIEASEVELKKLLENCKTQLYFEEIFPTPKGKGKIWSRLIPSKDVAPSCIPS